MNDGIEIQRYILSRVIMVLLWQWIMTLTLQGAVDSHPICLSSVLYRNYSSEIHPLEIAMAATSSLKADHALVDPST